MSTRRVAIEGIDGSGKTEQLKRLKQHLESSGATVETLSFPAYGRFFGDELGRLLSGDHPLGAHRLDPKSISLWYAMDRWETIRNVRPSDYLLLNRYTLSSVVYQTARAGEPIDGALGNWIRQLEHRILGLPEPDLYVILDLTPDISKSNVAAKGHREYLGARTDVYEQSSSLLSEARDRYRSAALRFPNTVLIDCLDTTGRQRAVDAIQNDIREQLTLLTRSGAC